MYEKLRMLLFCLQFAVTKRASRAIILSNKLSHLTSPHLSKSEVCIKEQSGPLGQHLFPVSVA